MDLVHGWCVLWLCSPPRLATHAWASLPLLVDRFIYDLVYNNGGIWVSLAKHIGEYVDFPITGTSKNGAFHQGVASRRPGQSLAEWRRRESRPCLLGKYVLRSNSEMRAKWESLQSAQALGAAYLTYLTYLTFT